MYGGGTVDGQARRWVVGRWPQQKVVLNFNDSSCELPLECRQGLACARAQAQALVWVDETAAAATAAAPAQCNRRAAPARARRPRLVGVVDSEDVRISGLTLVDPIYWTLHIVRSRGVRVEGVRILGDFQM